MRVLQVSSKFQLDNRIDYKTMRTQSNVSTFKPFAAELAS